MENKEIESKDKKEKKKIFNKWFYIGFVVTFILAISVVVGCFFYFQGVLGLTIEKSLYRMLCDSFAFPAVILLLVYALMAVSKEGAFDALSYGIQLAFFTIFYNDLRKTKIPATYTEYREIKMGKERSSFLYLLIVGLIFLFIAIIFLGVYYGVGEAQLSTISR
ncbi:MAG: DUF3899 domain-containing protein [Bacilli bacterium]